MWRGFPRFPSSAEWTNVPLDVRSWSGSSCASRAAFVVLVPVVEVRPLDSVRAVCGACRIVDEVLRRRPRRRRDPGLLLGSPIAWEALFCRQSTCLGSLAGRPSGVRLADVDRSSGVPAAPGLAGALDGRAAPCVIGARCVGSCSSRPSRQSVVLGSGSGRVVVRGLVGARRDAGWRVRLLDAGLLDVVRIPVLVVALWSFGSTTCLPGVVACRSTRRVRVAPAGVRRRFEGEIAPLNRELGPRNCQ